MATGLAIPPRANATGGVALSSGNDQDNSIIAIALGSDDTEHAFQQDTGLGDDIIFDINDPLAQAVILGRLRKIFDTFTRLKRFKLLENTIDWTQLSGDMILTFKYVAMETDAEPQTFSATVASPNGQAAITPSNNA
jgi:hypothetical protein